MKTVNESRLTLPVRISVLVFIFLLLIGVCLIFSFPQFLSWSLEGIYDTPVNQDSKGDFVMSTPDEIFLKYIWGEIPSEISEIKGVEGVTPFSEGPAFVRFQSTSSFVSELTTKNYGIYGPYASTSCVVFDNIASHNLIRDYPEKFEWWVPSKVDDPACYKTQGYQDDDSKYILFDRDKQIVYFYRTATCGLCPD